MTFVKPVEVEVTMEMSESHKEMDSKLQKRVLQIDLHNSNRLDEVTPIDIKSCQQEQFTAVMLDSKCATVISQEDFGRGSPLPPVDHFQLGVHNDSRCDQSLSCDLSMNEFDVDNSELSSNKANLKQSSESPHH